MAKDLKSTIEKEISKMLAEKSEPSEGRMKLLKLGIGFLAVNAKLEENEYGGFFGDELGATGGLPQGAKSSSRKRENNPDAGGLDLLDTEAEGNA